VLLVQEILRTQLRRLIPGAQGELELIAFGLILVLIMLFMPEGLTVWGLRRLRGRRMARGAAPAGR
jgi:branched-chain amino acid transport system permease protein